MKHRSRQQGISFLGLLALAVIVGFFVLVGLKLFPIYLESFKIDKAMNSIVSDPALVAGTRDNLYHSLFKRLDINDVQSVGERNYKQTIKITKKDRKVTIEIRYERETHLIGNLSVVARFDKVVEN